MDFLGFIEKLQKKPKETRLKIFILALGISSIFVIGGFAVSSKLIFASPIFKENDAGKNIPNHLPALKESIKASIKEIFNFKKEIENEIKIPENQSEQKVYKLPETE